MLQNWGTRGACIDIFSAAESENPFILGHQMPPSSFLVPATPPEHRLFLLENSNLPTCHAEPTLRPIASETLQA